MIKEYNGFAACPDPIIEPCIVHTEYSGYGFPTQLVWLRHPDVKSGNISGAEGIDDLMLFFQRTKKPRFKRYETDIDFDLTREEFFSFAEEKCPEFYEWLLWHADWF